jgi:hypothetical protein
LDSELLSISANIKNEIQAVAAAVIVILIPAAGIVVTTIKLITSIQK